MQPYQEKIWEMLKSGEKLKIDLWRRPKSHLFEISHTFAEEHGERLPTTYANGMKQEKFKVYDKTWMFISRDRLRGD